MVFMKHTIAVFLLACATCAAAASMPTSARAHDLLSSLTAGPEQCAVSEIDAEADALDTDMDENELNLRRAHAKSKKCYWAGTAPFCMGVCRPGETLVRRSAFGDGARCWTGTKAYCCPPGAINGPGKSTDPDRTTTKPAPKITTPAPKATAPITTPDRSQVPLAGQNPSAPKKSTSKGKPSKKTPPSPKQQPPSGGQSAGSPHGPKRLPQQDIGVHDDRESGNGLIETAKDILSGFKELNLNKLNFMGHFGESGADDETKEEGDSEEHPEHT